MAFAARIIDLSLQTFQLLCFSTNPLIAAVIVRIRLIRRAANRQQRATHAAAFGSESIFFKFVVYFMAHLRNALNTILKKWVSGVFLRLNSNAMMLPYDNFYDFRIRRIIGFTCFNGSKIEFGGWNCRPICIDI